MLFLAFQVSGSNFNPHFSLKETVLSGFKGGLSITRGIFGGGGPKIPLVMDSPPSKPLGTAPYKQIVNI
jgi:hypothetical protein